MHHRLTHPGVAWEPSRDPHTTEEVEAAATACKPVASSTLWRQMQPLLCFRSNSLCTTRTASQTSSRYLPQCSDCSSSALGHFCRQHKTNVVQLHFTTLHSFFRTSLEQLCCNRIVSGAGGLFTTSMVKMCHGHWRLTTCRMYDSLMHSVRLGVRLPT